MAMNGVGGESPDYYETLQVSRSATALIITKAYRLLAALYHPDNTETGNAEAFRAVVEAHAVLADPVRRTAYDRERFGLVTGSAGRVEAPADSPVTEVLYRDEQELRNLIMLALYSARRSRPYNGAIPFMGLLELFGCSSDDVQFTLWYLRGKKFIEQQDDGVVITVAGVDYVEALEKDRDAIALPSHSSISPGRDILSKNDYGGL
jgi:curved DNA-binding protein CbpA